VYLHIPAFVKINVEWITKDKKMLNRTIMLVDDEKTVLESLGNYLRESEYDVVTATSGEDAVAKFHFFPCDMVVTDIIMGKMNGLELLKELKEFKSDVCGEP